MSRPRMHPGAALLPALLFAAPAVAGDLNINVVVTPASYSGCDDITYDWIDQGTCDDLAASPVAGPAFAWLVASETDGFPEGIGAIQFGIEHSLDVLDWTICTGGS